MDGSQTILSATTVVGVYLRIRDNRVSLLDLSYISKNNNTVVNCDRRSNFGYTYRELLMTALDNVT